MAKLQSIKRTNGSTVFSVNIPLDCIEEVDWKTEPWNARIYHEMWVEWLAAIEANPEELHPFNPFIWWMQQN